MSKIAFIGLGNMGGPMAANLLKAGHEVTVFDLMPEAVKQLTDAGASSADTAAVAAADADVVVTMLPAGKHVEMVYMGENGLLDAVKPDALLLDSSTIDAATARKVAAAANEKNIAVMDTPVSGGVAAAAAGTLAFMCGGSEESFAKAKPILEGMGKNIFHAGDHGAGQVAKVCNNMLLSVLMVGTSEALRLGTDNGLDAAKLSEIMLASSGRNWTLEVYNPYPGVMETAPASNDFNPGFMVDLMCKDLGLAMDTAVQTQSSTPMGALARSLYTAHQSQGNGGKDFSSIIESLGKSLSE
ncbi:3-hydroxyisobutyrate dehydrogenase [Oceanicoccus sagamiensis]|uniref:3-hydroxyisobutyrate dehydrogenase n=1 Tax=Oceanicoccus sagamiensis TaxID=716816 RepID=A0A1X9NL99_9GAMM|nr:3-hydroxyisobutyrate dehydrogenase [Oceanicoccus sagamiensis]ARN75607.1 3-hydroxyisobutyrate dehydrogenase [Oceanicoccus sagamiensis]